ncbi:MAG TPA: hypothetical protein VJB66_04125 [Candidatus Nanoarchaeia archaeon]|nr:hypothetical protein [Candidatus Nanoarchaeia archaeon]
MGPWTIEEQGIYDYVQGEKGKHLSGHYTLDKDYRLKVFEMPDLIRELVQNMNAQYGNKPDSGPGMHNDNKLYGNVSLGSIGYKASPMYGTPDVRYH